ncbi:MAG: FecR domain-containing protein [Verrucomicrobiota bacterium]|jgi:hypothetical protein
MKRIKSLLVFGLVLAFASVSTWVLAEGAKKATQATVRAVHGTATYSIAGGMPQPLRPNMELPEGSVIETGMDAQVDLQVNGRASTVRVEANTKMTLQTMENLGAGDTETMLDIRIGQAEGSVKKITKASKYEITTPRGVAGIRGTDWAVQVSQNADGTYNVTFTSATGTVYVVANINVAGVPTSVPRTLTTGQSWTPPLSVGGTGEIPPTTQALADIIAASQAAAAAGAGPVTVTTPGVNAPPGTPGSVGAVPVITITVTPPPNPNPSSVGGS